MQSAFLWLRRLLLSSWHKRADVSNTMIQPMRVEYLDESQPMRTHQCRHWSWSWGQPSPPGDSPDWPRWWQRGREISTLLHREEWIKRSWTFENFAILKVPKVYYTETKNWKLFKLLIIKYLLNYNYAFLDRLFETRLSLNFDSYLENSLLETIRWFSFTRSSPTN